MDIQKTNIQTELLKEISQDAERTENFDDEILEQKLRSYKIDNDEKERTIAWKQANMNKVYGLCIACIACVLIIIFLDGFSQFDHFSLPVGVIVAIISGFVIHSLGLYAIVLYNLFPKGKTNKTITLRE